MIAHVGFTGTRELLPQPQILGLARTLADLYRQGARFFHHGDCVGADEAGAVLAHVLGYRIIAHPPINVRLRAYVAYDEQRPPLEYLDRNRVIVDESHILVGCPFDGRERPRSGSWMTIRYAVVKQVPVQLIGPDGHFLEPPSLAGIAGAESKS